MTQASSTPASGVARSLAPVYHSALEMIGNTPMLELTRLESGPCRLFGKLEMMNPAGSIKDRIGLSMIEAAEREGRLDPNADPKPTIIEGTAGNTGLGLALVAGQRGYRMLVVVPDKMSEGKIQHLRAMGAEVVLARSDVQKGHPEYYQDVAARLAQKTPNSIYINQFSNPDNTAAHYDQTGPEIHRQLEAFGGVDVFIAGIGSGGTISGVGRYLKEQNPNCRIVLADPVGSILEPLVNRGEKVKPGSWLVEGMGEDFIPDICDLSFVDEAIAVTDAESFHAARDLLDREGLLAGSSTGCLIAAAKKFCAKQTKPLNVVTLICDQGAKYLGKMFNDYWMIDNGFIEREKSGDLRDLIARRHASREDYVAKPTDPLSQVIKVMELHNVSQLAVVETVHLTSTGRDHDKVVGIIDESDILMAVVQGESALSRPVSDFMTTRIETISPRAKVEDLIPIFRADRVAIVVDDHAPTGAGTDFREYLGLITKIDLINYLRRQLK
ncbi:MAG: pyridoxal-phosphate dependent enzyme [Phycisphaerales bacterium]